MRSPGKSGALSLDAKEKILAHIKENDLRVDEALPTEARLMKMLGVSRYTVREALALLEQERILYRVQGKGTFLKRRPLQIEQGLEKLESVTEIIKSCGLVPSTRWIGIEVKFPSGKIADSLAFHFLRRDHFGKVYREVPLRDFPRNG